MSWLPESLPENVKLIISTSQSPSSISESLGWTVPPVTNIASPTPSSAISPTPPHIGSDNLIRVMCRVQDTVAWFARALLTYSSRRMTDGQLACLQRLSPESPLVAWLTVGDLTTTGCRVEHRCLADAFAGVVNAARRRHGRSVVDAVLCFIDACGSGISDSEMVDVLTRYHTAADTDQYPGEERTTPVDSGVANSCARTAARNATKTLNGQAPSTPSTPTAVSTSRSSLVVSPPRRFSPFTWLYIRRSLYPLLSHTADGRTCWRCSALARQWNPPQSTCARAKSTASACTPTAAQRDAAHCTLADYFAGAVNSSSSAPTSRPQSCESTPSRSSRLTTPLAFTAPPSTPILPPIGAPDIPSYGKPKTSTATTTKVSRPLTPNSTPARPPSRTPPNSAAPRVRHAPKPPTQTHPLASTTTTIAPAITATTIATTSSSQEQVYQPAQPVLINDDPLIYNRRKLDELPLHLMASRRFSQLERYVLFDYDWMRARIYSKPSVQEG